MRRKQYTEKELKKIPCAGCGQPSTQQWQICSLNSMRLGVCEKCDVNLNRAVLKLFNIRGWPYLITKYGQGKKISDKVIREVTGLGKD